MDKKHIRYRLILRYLKSLSGILMLLGFLFLFISGWIDWHSLVQNIGLALTAAGITTFIFKFELREIVTDDEIRKSGIEIVRHGRNSILETIGNLEDFLRKSRPKEIDIIGISMYSLFEPTNLYNLLISLANENYKIRIIFAHPESLELTLQEEMEHKPGSLKYHINYLVDAFRKRLHQYSTIENILTNLTLWHSKLLPKEFIMRAGSQMIVSKYFYRGPHFSPTFLLREVPNGFFESYRQYFEDVIERSSVKIDMVNSQQTFLEINNYQ
jgi:hypothetical protein